ncbi:RAD50-interacting protein 1-like [Oratosquilla oratoria]|uniref:RAD50-interacting protein 1-like n=1 Tax=Oratosquilla oratoria TaxID=337810 RepID=UPI003F76FB8F
MQPIPQICYLKFRTILSLYFLIAFFSSEIESSLSIGAEGQAMVGYKRLSDAACEVKDTACKNLFSFVRETLLHWHGVLKDRFTKEFELVLKAIKWPFTNQTVHLPPASQEQLQRLDTLTQYLLQLTLPRGISAPPPSTPPPMPPITADFPQTTLPLQLLLRPLQVRFVYHFSSNKATNSREHPEWYLTRVLKWIEVHEDFLTKRIQPVLNRCGHQHSNAKIEFMSDLVRLVTLKLCEDLREIQYDDDLMCHTIQETLNFERELCHGFGYPASQPSVLAVLTRAQVFLRWIQIERKFALEVMDELVSGDDAWTTVEGGEAAHCGEELVLLLQGITDRYKRLPQPGHRLQFLELQLELLDDFRVRLVQVMKSEKRDPLASNYVAILNTAHHLSSLLQDWADLPFFVEMQYYAEQFQKLQEHHTASMISDHSRSSPITSPDDLSTFTCTSADLTRTPALNVEAMAKQDALSSLNCSKLSPTNEDLSDVEGSVFDSTVSLYGHLQTEMIRTLANYVVTEVRARSQPYRKDKWFSMEHNAKEPSPSFCPLLETLARHLATLRDTLHPLLFTQLWHIIADALNKFVYEEVILQNHFNEAGATQLQYDMFQGLFPIFGQFTQKPENYFKLIKESALLLTLGRATALLLRETIRAWRDDKESFSLNASPVKALAEHGVSLLLPEDADVILNIRTNMATL